MPYNVQLPNGLLIEGIPDDVSKEEARRRILEKFPELAPKTGISDYLKDIPKAIGRGAVGLLENAGIGAAAALPEEYETKAREFITGAATPAKEYLAPATPEIGESISSKLAAGVGSTAPFFVLGPMGLAGRLGAAGLGTAAGAGEARIGAEQEGATPEQRATATALGAPTGLLDLLAPNIGPLKSLITTALARGGVEGATEAAQKIAQNMIAQGVYNPEQDVLAGSGEEGAYGAGVGALTSLIIDLALGRRAKGPKAGEQPPAAPPIAETTSVPPVVMPEATAIPPETITPPPTGMSLDEFQAQAERRRLEEEAFEQERSRLAEEERQQAMAATQERMAGVPGIAGAPGANEAMMGEVRRRQAEEAAAEQARQQAEVQRQRDEQLAQEDELRSQIDEINNTTFSADPVQNQIAKDRALGQLRSELGSMTAARIRAEQAEPPKYEPITAPQEVPKGAKVTKFTPEEEAEIEGLKSNLSEVNKEIAKAKKEKTSLFNRLKGELIYRPGSFGIKDIDSDNKALGALFNKKGQGVLLEDLVADGSLDEFLPARNRALIGGVQNPNFDASAAVEHIADKLRTRQYGSTAESEMLGRLTEEKDRIQQEIDRLQTVPEVNLDLARRAAVPKAEEEQISLPDLEADAQMKGVDTESLKQRVAKDNPDATPEQFLGFYRGALDAATSQSPSYTIGGFDYTADEFDNIVSESLTDEEIDEYIRQAEAEQAAIARTSKVTPPRGAPKPPAQAPGQTQPEQITPPDIATEPEDIKIPGARQSVALGDAVVDNDWDRITDELQKSKNPIIANIGRMSRDLPGVFTEINPRVVRASNPRALAGWSPSTNGIYFKNKTATSSEHVVAHEITHALTYYSVKNPRPDQKAAVKRLDNLYRFVKTKLKAEGKGKLYGLKNMDEFLAEANGNPDFQKELARIPYQKQTAWGAFTQAVADILGIKNSSALTEVLALTEELTTTPASSKTVAKGTKKIVPVEGKAETIPQGLEQAGFTRLPKDSPRRYRQGNNSYGTWEKDGVRVSLSQNVLADERGVVQKYMADDNEMTFEALLVDPDKRNQGLAKKALELVTNLADSQGRTLYLEPVQLEKGSGLNEKQLQDLYARYGFKKTTPSSKVMVREPQSEPKSLLALELSQTARDALEILEGQDRKVKEPEPGYIEKTKKSWDNAVQNPQLTREQAIGTFRKWADQFETWAFSSDAGLNNQIRKAVMDSMIGQEEKIGILLNSSLSQTVHSDAVANLFLTKGDIKWDDVIKKWVGVDSDNNILKLSKQMDAIADKHGMTKEQIELIAHTAFEAKRTQSMIRNNANIAAQAEAMRAEAKRIRGSSPVAASELLDKANRLDAKQKIIHMTPEQIQAGMTQYELFPELNELVKTWNGIRGNAIKVMVDTGLYSEEEAENLLANADYVPFFREDQIEQGKGPKEFLRSLSVQADKRMKGSMKPVNDIFDNMVRWTQYAVNRGVRNRSALALVDTAGAVGLGEKVADPKDGENVVRVWRNGQEEYHSMADPMFVSAFQGLESVSIPTVKFFSKFADVLRNSVVLFPLFSVSQVTQDSFAAMFSSGLKPQHALSIPFRAVKEFIQTLRGKSSAHEELKNVGAVGVRDFTSSIIRSDVEVMAGLKKDKNFWEKVKRGLGTWAMAADNAVRQATYEAAIAQGMSRSEAIEKAFEIFNVRRRGSSQMLAMAGQVIPFFNAYLAAQNVAYRTLTGEGISPTERKAALQTLAATTASVMALSMLYAMMMGDDEGYEKKPTPTRDRLLIIPGTNGNGIPLRSDLFLLPKVLAEHTYHLLTENGMTDPAKFRASMASLLANSFLSPTVVPQAVKPVVEAAINFDFFQQQPLVGIYQSKKAIDRQFTNSTSEFAKALAQVPIRYNFEKAEWQGIASPIAIDHIVRGMFGSFGGLFLEMTNPIIAAAAGTTRPAMSIRDAFNAIPNASAFISKEYEVGLRKDFYALKDVTDRAANTLSDYKQRNPEEIKAFLEDPKNKIRVGMAPMVNSIAQKLTEIRKNVDLITNIEDPKYTADRKEEMIKKFREQEYQLLKNIDLRKLREMAQM